MYTSKQKKSSSIISSFIKRATKPRKSSSDWWGIAFVYYSPMRIHKSDESHQKFYFPCYIEACDRCFCCMEATRELLSAFVDLITYNVRRSSLNRRGKKFVKNCCKKTKSKKISAKLDVFRSMFLFRKEKNNFIDCVDAFHSWSSLALIVWG